MNPKGRLVSRSISATDTWLRRTVLSLVGVLMFSGIANAYCWVDQDLEATRGPTKIHAPVFHDGASESSDCHTSPDLAAQEVSAPDISWDCVAPVQVGAFAPVYTNQQVETIRLRVFNHALHPPEPRFLQVVRLLI